MQKKAIKIWDFHVNTIVISKLFETNNYSKCLIGHLDEVIRPLLLILPKSVDILRHLNRRVEVRIKIIN